MTDLHFLVVGRFWEELAERASGPFHFRFVLQPIMAAIFATRDGIADARAGRSPYFWTVLSDPRQRGPRLKEGLAAVSKILIVGVIMDLLFQWKMGQGIRLIESIVVAFLVGFIPYLLIRGPVARIAGRGKPRPIAHG
jgi:hypothetical protein